MRFHKKTLIGSIISFILGTSCCWLSSIAIWFGGAGFIGVIVKYVEDFQTQLILLSLALGMISVYLYRKKKTTLKKIL